MLDVARAVGLNPKTATISELAKIAFLINMRSYPELYWQLMYRADTHDLNFIIYL
jgi:hypothetical protein